MNAANHTPGPWRLSDGSPDVGVVTDEKLIAMVTNDEDSPMDVDEQLANSRLVAAAPDLLAALRRLLARSFDGDDYDATSEAEAAIAKAEGREYAAEDGGFYLPTAD